MRERVPPPAPTEIWKKWEQRSAWRKFWHAIIDPLAFMVASALWAPFWIGIVNSALDAYYALTIMGVIPELFI